MASEDDNDNVIPISFDISNAQGITDAQNRLEAMLQEVGKATQGTGKLSEASQQLVSTLGGLRRMLDQLSDGSLFQQSLNASATAANNTTRAFKELETQKLQTDEALRTAIRSGDTDQIAQAAKAIQRDIAQLTVSLAALNRVGQEADEKAIEQLTRRLALAEANLREAERAAAEARFTQGVERRTQGRQAGYQAAQAYQGTPEGQAEAEAARERAERQAAYSAAQAEDIRRTQEANTQRRLEVEAAQVENKKFDRFQSDVEKAELQNETRYNPDYRAAKQVSNAQLAGATAEAISDDPDSVEAIAQANVARRKKNEAIKAREDQLYPKEEQPEREEPSYWEKKTQSLLGDGGSGIFAFHAQIQAQYIVLNQLFEAYSNVQREIIEFDKNMTDLSAITGASTDQIEKLRTTIVAVSTATPFSANELAKVSTGLAEKGVSAGEITSALPNIANLASATGSSAADSGEIFSAAFENFKLSGAGSAAVADQLTVALNKTRLSATNFDQAIQSAQETAKTSGLSFAEMNAALGALSNQGLRNGSLLGQGLSSVLTELQEPPKKLAERFAELGITNDQLNVKSNTLVGVLDNLKAAGFTSADAFETLSGRQAKAFAAALDGVGAMKTLYAEMLNTQGAAQINAQRMQSLDNSFKALQNTMFAIAQNATRPLIDALKEVGGGFTSLLQGVNANSKAFTIMGTILESLAAAAALRWISGLVGGFTLLTTVAEGASVAVAGLIALVTAGSLGAGAAPVLGFIALAGAIGLAIAGLSNMEASSRAAIAEQKELQEQTNEATDKVNEQAKALDKLNEFYTQSINRSGELQKDQGALQGSIAELRSQFGSLSLSVFDNVSSYDQLIVKIRQVRSEVQEGLAGALAIQGQAATTQANAARTRLSGLSSAGSVRDLASNIGVATTDYVEGAPVESNLDPATLAAQQYGANSVQARFLRAAASGDKSAIYRIAQEAANDKSLPSNVLSGIQGYSGDVASASVSLGSATASQQDVTAKNAVLGIEQTPGYSALDADGVALINASKALDGLGSNRNVVGRNADLQAIEAKIKTALDGINNFVSTLPAGQKEAFNQTDLGKRAEELSSKLKTVQHDMTDALAKSAVDNASADLKETSQEMALALEQVRTSKGPERVAAFARFKNALDKNYDAEKEQINARFKREEKETSDIKALERNRDIDLRAAEIKYQDELLRAQTTADRPGRAAKADPNRPIAAKPTDYASDISDALKVDETNLKDALDASKGGLTYQEAYLNAERSQPSASKADIKKREDDLAKARLSMEEKELAAYDAQISSLQTLYTTTEGDIQKTSAEINSLLSQNGVTKDAKGNLDPTSFANASARSDFKIKYEALEAQLKKLETLVVDIKDKTAQAQTQAAGIQGQVDARNSVPAPNFTNTAKNAINDFGESHGLNANEYKTESDVIKSALDSADKSLSSFFTNLENGTTKGKNAFKQFALSILGDVEKIINDKLAAQILGYLGSSITGLFGGGDAGTVTAGGITNVAADGSSVTTLPAAVIPGSYHGTANITREKARANKTATPLPSLHFYRGGHVHKLNTHHTEVVPEPPTGGSLGFNAPVRHPLHFFGGGAVPGPDIGRDSIPALLTGGESVLNTRATQMLGSSFIDQINSGMLTQKPMAKPQSQPQAKQELSVFVVDKSSVPQMGPKDVLATIGEDIRNNGVTKKLIANVINGG